MLQAICLWYHVLPDVDAMPLDEVEWWYDGIRQTLKSVTAPKPQ
jgi:hypothetical protein